MTCCVAALCDDGKTIIMVADKLIGIGFIESEPDISKLLELHFGWKVMLSGDDISSIFDIMDYAKKEIVNRGYATDQPVPLETAMTVIRDSYEKKRMEEAESLYLKPSGWDVASFNAGGHVLPDYGEIKWKVENHSLPIELLVAGFSEGRGHILALPAVARRKG